MRYCILHLIDLTKYNVKEIITAGRNSYFRLGEDFRMSDVAKELNTKASTLYRHVKNKRELYFAMLTAEFVQFDIDIGKLISKYDKPNPETIIKTMGSFILEMSRNNFQKFSLMFLTKPPEVGAKGAIKNNAPGPFENNCDPQTIGFIVHIVQDLIDQYNLKNQSAVFITYTLISIILGAGIVVSSYYEYLNEDFIKPNEYEKFHEFVVESSLALFKI